MGWCSGTDIFDAVAGELLGRGTEPSPERTKVLRALILALEDHDWDCQSDSAFSKHPEVCSLMRELHPDWDWGQGGECGQVLVDAARLRELEEYEFMYKGLNK